MIKFTINKVSSKPSVPRKPTVTILNKDVSGVVDINNGEYSVLFKSKSFKIKQSCYDSKGVRCVYKRVPEGGKRFCLVRDIDRHSMNSNNYLPFAPGLVVRGDIIVDDIEGTVFVIKHFEYGEVAPESSSIIDKWVKEWNDQKK